MSGEATIRRGVRNARYAAIPNHVFEDARLSMEARWLLGYLLSKPDNWTVVIGDIIKKGNCGRDKARKMIAELVELGYAEREQTRDDGKFAASVLVIFDEPKVGINSENIAQDQCVASLPQTEIPATASPSTDLPSPVKSAPSNNSDSANTESYQERGGVREISEDDPKSLRKRFQALIVGRHNNPWPDVLSSAPEWAFQQFVRLSPEERLRAEERRDAYLAACPKLASGEHKGNPKAAALGVYLRDRMFDLVDAIAPQVVSRQAEKRRQEESIPVAPFGPIWAGKRALALLSGAIDIDLPANLLELAVETYNRLQRSNVSTKAWLDHRGIIVDGNELVFPDGYREQERRRRECDGGYPEAHALDKLAKERGRGAADARFTILADLCEAVPVGSETYERWRSYHQQMNWPFVPDPGGMRVVYFPKGGPEGLREFEIAARAALGMERGDDDAV
ncbi:helix-turn-helix domain-containing protein [Rhizobium sp. N324]|uniref:helix-turn-helix domain-containing protein n=1 Tax=Rhizobium sp. N324 TaxID=1703969 RepID=UPI0007EA05FF|nr:helix-turn-helix domain-containing protein [Rhizobium sp. N324]ANM12065.1 hypothetical protein AMK05_CH03716 [Rhizobium sp. N324]